MKGSNGNITVRKKAIEEEDEWNKRHKKRVQVKQTKRRKKKKESRVWAEVEIKILKELRVQPEGKNQIANKQEFRFWR